MSSAPSGEEGAKAKTRDASGRSGGRGNTDRDSAQEEEVRRIEQCNLFYMFENRPKCPCVTAFLLRSYRAVSTHAPRPCNGSVLPSVIRILGALMLKTYSARKKGSPHSLSKSHYVPYALPSFIFLLHTVGKPDTLLSRSRSLCLTPLATCVYLSVSITPTFFPRPPVRGSHWTAVQMSRDAAAEEQEDHPEGEQQQHEDGQAEAATTEGLDGEQTNNNNSTSNTFSSRTILPGEGQRPQQQHQQQHQQQQRAKTGQKQYVMALDVGTTKVKALIFDEVSFYSSAYLVYRQYRKPLMST